MARPDRRSVDLSPYPGLVVVYLGYRVAGLRGVFSLLRLRPGLDAVKRDPPDGLLLHEDMMFGLLHPGFRQYWRDLESLEAFTRSPRHAAWWRDFGRDTGGGGIWHESYRLGGGMEGIYSNVPAIGFGRFAPERAPVGAAQGARGRLDGAVAATPVGT